MAMFVHIGGARKQRSFKRSGIRPGDRRREGSGVFAMPVLPNHFISHQWLREMKRNGARTMVAIYFRIPDREPVVVGHYSTAHVPMTARPA